MQRDVQDMWSDYKASGGRGLRNELILRYASLVRAVASKVSSTLPNTIERDDLISYGTFGLIDAIDKYDPDRHSAPCPECEASRDEHCRDSCARGCGDRHIKFETYAMLRIRGSIIDELRTQDWVPRSVRSKARNIDRAIQELSAELGRAPEESEIAERLGVTVAELWVLQSEASATAVTALDEHEGDEERPSISDTLFDVSSNPEDILAVDEILNRLASAVDAMSERAKTIIVLYYLEEMTLAEIGEVLGVTESRVCQLQGKLLQSLRHALASGHAA